MTKKQTQLMSQSEYARHRGVSRQYISSLIKQGILPLRSKRIDPEVADSILLARSHPMKGLERRYKTLKDAPVKNLSEVDAMNIALMKIKIKNEAMKAKLLEIQRGVLSGKLIEAERAEKIIFNHARPTRDLLLSIPDRVHAQIAAMNDIEEIRALLLKEMTQAMEPMERLPKALRAG